MIKFYQVDGNTIYVRPEAVLVLIDDEQNEVTIIETASGKYKLNHNADYVIEQINGAR